jgi:hypothetical protein
VNAGLAAAQTPQEKFRVQLASETLQQQEQFMKLRRDLAEGRYENLAQNRRPCCWQQAAYTVCCSALIKFSARKS